jgi:CheY-like chemotaxis protein
MSANGSPAMAGLLVAEDDEDYRAVLELIFVRAGFRVRSARDGLAALRLAIDEPPDVVLTDMDMPRLTGVELCQALRGHPALNDIPVAVLSGSLRPDDRRVVEARVCGVLLKPSTTVDLVGAVRRLADFGRHVHADDPALCPRTATLP